MHTHFNAVTDSTLLDSLASHARMQPDRLAFGSLRDGTKMVDSVSWGELWALSQMQANELARLGLRGRAALLLCPDGLEFAVAFVACLLAGVVVVPMPLPRKRLQWERMTAALATADIAAVLGNDVGRLPLDDAGLHGIHRVEVSLANLRAATLSNVPGVMRAGPNDRAFLQYTSGSTNVPRGVSVSHGNILANQRRIQAAFGTTSDSIGVSWLPLFHDMGLIGTLLHPIFVGFPMLLMAPATFLRRPEVWLQAISCHRATVSGAPNFAYRLCADRMRTEGLDLSCWTTAFCGAERVDAAAMSDFCSRFAGAGFSRHAFAPCYGLAEATLFVSGGPPGRAPTTVWVDPKMLAQGAARQVSAGEGIELVGCGEVTGADEVQVVNPTTGAQLELLSVGEIWVRGPSVSAGYVGEPKAGEDVFNRHMLDGSHGWLATGDLGFLDASGELFVCGRRKEMIVIRGRNIFAQDIESVVQAAAPELEPTACAAVAISADGSEALAIVAEWRRTIRHRDEDAVCSRIRNAVSDACDVVPALIRLVSPGQLPRTTSGKLRRNAVAQALLINNARVAECPRVSAATPMERALARAIGTATGMITLDFSASASANGLDSVAVFQVQATLLEQSHLALDATQLLAAESLAAAAAFIVPIDVDWRAPESFPLTSNQLALWLDQQRRPQSAEHLLCVPLQLSESLDVERLRAAFQNFLEAHRLLTMQVRADDEGVRWCARENSGETFTSSRLPLVEREVAIVRMANTALGADAPLFQLHHFASTVAGEGDVLVLLAHHLVSDATALHCAVMEIECRYFGLDTRPATDFSQFAAEQQAWLDTPAAADAANYWRQLLQRVPERWSWPGRARPDADVGLSKHIEMMLPASIVQSLREHAAQLDVTPFHLMIAAFATVVARWTGTQRLACCVPLLGRGPGYERLQGYCVQPAVVVLEVAAARDLDMLAHSVKAQCHDALRHPWLQMHRVATPQVAEADAAFRIIVDCQPARLGRAGKGIRWQMCRLPSPPAMRRQDVTLALREIDAGFVGEFEYRHDTLGDALADRLVKSWLQLLADTVAHDPRPPLDVVRLPREDWSVQATQRLETPARIDWVNDILEHARETPDAIALVAGAHELSYIELLSWAEAVASQLRARDLGRERRVAVLMQRSPALVVALLGVLLSGAAYVPLDPTYPPDLTQRICLRAAPDLILVDHGATVAIEGVPVLAIAGKPPSPLPPLTTAPGGLPEQLAYLIYTSGSTGQPKGVCIRHGAVASLLAWARSFYPASVWRGVAATTSVCFDLSVFELFATLACGGTIHLFDHALSLLANRDDSRLHLINTVPSALRELVTERALPSSVEVVNVAGEPLSEALVARFQQCYPQVKLVNLYGPSEDTTYSTAHVLPKAAQGRPVVGLALPGTEAWILDSKLRPVARGCIGELYLSGDGLARGYWSAPSQTAERFVPHPYAQQPGERLYRTGDLAILDENGNLDLRGRNDHQIKFRGFRIELGDIETALLQELDVTDAVVVAESGSAGETVRLVAHIAPDWIDVDKVRRSLERRLPSYMVPSVVQLWPSLPLGPNGKVDRERLVAAAVAGPLSHHPPRTPLEAEVMAIWLELLPHGGFGMDDDFFACGGHSLLLMQMARALRTRCGVQLSLAELFGKRTIASIAATVEHRKLLEQVLSHTGSANSPTAPPPVAFEL